MLRRLVLWRHGETDYNAALRIQGQLDSQLTELGLRQARLAAPVLAALAPELMRTSDLRRAADTAAVLSGLIGLPADVDKRLRETHLGQWQGLDHDQVEAGWPGAMLRWRSDASWAPPGGESRVEVAARAAQVVGELDQHGAGVALLCTHGGLIAGLTGHLLGLPVSTWRVLGGIGNCHWTLLERRSVPGWRLVAYNAGAG